MDNKLKVIAYIKLVNKNQIEEGMSALSVKVEKVNVVLGDNIIGEDPEIEVEVVGVEE